MGIEISAEDVICTRCGTKYSRRKGYFPVSYAESYKGVGYMHICRECLDKTYASYLSQCNDIRTAVRQVCRKYDIYWSDAILDSVMKASSTRSIMSQYLTKLNRDTCVGKSYDDTLIEEDSFWSFGLTKQNIVDSTGEAGDAFELTDDIVAFWGRGYSPTMYADLEQRRMYYMSKFPDGTILDIGSEALLRQICNLEVNIAKDSMDRKSIDKYANTLNTLLGSLNLKPVQNKESDAGFENIPHGVWVKRLEDERPVSKVDPDLEDVDGIVRYISIWFLGHLCSMLGIKNTYCKLYEEEIARMKVELPQYDVDDNEEFFNEVFSERTE